MNRRATEDAGPLGPDLYLDALRAGLRKVVRGEAVDRLRSCCDDWSIGGGRIDPMEPLSNRGRREIAWPSDAWNSITFDLKCAVSTAAEEKDGTLPPELVAYVSFVQLELCARENPANGPYEESLVLPLVFAARAKTDATPFRRYVLGWRSRVAALDWIDERMSVQAALVVALGSTQDGAIGAWAAQCRAEIEERVCSSPGGLHGFMGARERAWWREAAAGAPTDAAAWAARHLG